MSTLTGAKHVTRHSFDAETLRELFASGVNDLVEFLGRPPKKLPQLVQYGKFGLAVLENASVFEREHPLLRTAARTFGQVQFAAVLLGARPKRQPVEFPLADMRVTIDAAGPNGQSGVNAWRDGWYGALMARDSATLDGLREVSDTTVLGASSRLDTYHYAWKDALALADTQPEQALTFVERAITLTGPAFATIAAPGVPQLAAAVFPILSGIVERNATRFNEALEAALEAHKAHWSNNAHASTGWIALGPLALACLAHDRGISIEVESEYLLPALIRGT